MLAFRDCDVRRAVLADLYLSHAAFRCHGRRLRVVQVLSLRPRLLNVVIVRNLFDISQRVGFGEDTLLLTCQVFVLHTLFRIAGMLPVALRRDALPHLPIV